MIALKIDLQCKQYKHLHTTPGYVHAGYGNASSFFNGS